jgi:hypothetical protein
MNRFLIFIFLLTLFLAGNGYSQDIYSEQPAVSINIRPIYESWTVNDSTGFSEFTNIISAGYNPFSNTSVGLVTRYASVGTDAGNIKHNLSSLSDMQIVIKQRLPDENLSFNAGVNIPTGKTKLKPDEFIVSQIISQELFGMHTSNFGTGLNAFLGATWLHPLSDNVVIGAGISYQIKSEYQPLADVPQKYAPSNELSLTAGLDIKLSETQTLTGDFTGIFYGSDKLDGKEIFSSGNRLIFNSMYRQFFGFDYLAIYLLYRNVGLDQLKGDYALLDNQKITPNQVYLGVSYYQKFNPSFSLGYGIFTSIYEKTAGYFSGYTIYGASLSPQFALSSSVSIPVFLKYAIGSAKDKTDLTNFEVGAGIKLNL